MMHHRESQVTRRGAMLTAAALFAGPTARAADGPDVPIRAMLAALMASMKAGTTEPFAQRFAKLAPAVDRAYDLPATLQATVGPRWTSFTPAQQAQLLDAFRIFTIARYTDNFDEFGGERLEVLPDTRAAGDDQIVPTQIVPTRGDTIRIDYVMHQTPQGWRAVDVLLNGTISQVAVQRSDFRALLASGGPDALVASLKDKVATLSGHTL